VGTLPFPLPLSLPLPLPPSLPLPLALLPLLHTYIFHRSPRRPRSAPPSPYGVRASSACQGAFAAAAATAAVNSASDMSQTIAPPRLAPPATEMASLMAAFCPAPPGTPCSGVCPPRVIGVHSIPVWTAWLSPLRPEAPGGAAPGSATSKGLPAHAHRHDGHRTWLVLGVPSGGGIALSTAESPTCIRSCAPPSSAGPSPRTTAASVPPGAASAPISTHRAAPLQPGGRQLSSRGAMRLGVKRLAITRASVLRQLGA